MAGRRGRPTVPIVLTDDERETLLRWERRHTSSQALARRCRIVLACAEGLTNLAVAEQVGASANTVSKWRHRFAEQRLEGLVDAPRPGAPRTVTDEIVERVVVDTLETTPKDATHWSTRSMADEVVISKTVTTPQPSTNPARGSPPSSPPLSPYAPAVLTSRGA